MNWFYAEGDRQTGPVTESELLTLAEQGVVTDETLVWREGTPDWQPYGAVKGGPLFSVVQPPAGGTGTGPETEAVCVECGRVFPESEMVPYKDVRVCGSCKPVFFQRLREGGLSLEMNYAGFWIRVGASIIDSFITGFVSFFFQMAIILGMAALSEEAAFFLSQAVGMGIYFGYYVFFHGKFGATPGKMLCRIKVVLADGSSIGYGRAFGRCLAEILSALILFIGYIMVAFDREKRGLHDHICNTRVIHV